MKKVKNKIVLFLCAALVACTVLPLAACGDRGVDPNRTQLYIGNYNGGMGSDWLAEVARAFEKKYPDVQVMIDNKKEEYNGEKLLSTMKTSRQAIYFTTEVSYEDAADKGLLEDITNEVTSPLSEYGEEASIEGKMDAYLQDYFKRSTPQNAEERYYGIPFFTAVYGIVYDRDLFTEKRFFNLEGYSTPNGPDGKANTFDDGLPATWEDFKILMSAMRDSGVTPFTWAGAGNEYYRRAFERAIWASYEGYNDYMLNYSFSGTDTTLGEITRENGYLLQRQEGKKAAVQASKDIVSIRENFSSAAFTTSQSHTAAHLEFLDSRFAGLPTKPIAMMLEGGWWENEARIYFDQLQQNYGEDAAYGKRNFGYMPIPRFIGTEGIADQENAETTLYSDGNTMVFINASVTEEQKDLAKKFLRFSTTGESLATCTRVTGVVRPFDYTLSETDLAAMTPYARSIWDVYSAENSRLTYSYNVSDLRYRHTTYFAEWDFGTTIGTNQNDPLEYFYRNPEGEVSTYFAGMQSRYDQASWEAILKG